MEDEIIEFLKLNRRSKFHAIDTQAGPRNRKTLCGISVPDADKIESFASDQLTALAYYFPKFAANSCTKCLAKVEEDYM